MKKQLTLPTRRFLLTVCLALVAVAGNGPHASASWFAGPEKVVPGIVFVEVRVKDGSIPDFHAARTEVTNAQYARFLAMTGRGSDKWFDTYASEPGNLPARGMTKADAVAMARWATAMCHAEGLIGPNQRLALPSDLQWTAMAGYAPGSEMGATPAERMANSRSGAYLHGLEQVPPKTAGNYLRLTDAGNVGKTGFEGDADGYLKASPVGVFFLPGLPLADLGGNVREFIADAMTPGGADCARGGSYQTATLAELAVSHRHALTAGAADDQAGFRLILETVPGK